MNCCSLWLRSQEEVVGNNKSFVLLSLSLKVKRNDLPTGWLSCCQYNSLALFDSREKYCLQYCC